MVRASEPPARREDVCYIREGGREYCIDPLDNVLSVLSKRWSLFVVTVLGNRDGARFNDLKRSIPRISARALSERLDEFRALDLVGRTVLDGESPPGVRYSLTAKGRQMRKALVPFLQWAAELEATAAPSPLQPAEASPRRPSAPS